MYKTGDIVTISPFLKDFDREKRPSIVPEMLELAGKQGRVVEVSETSYAPIVYRVSINGDTWQYLPEWLDGNELQINVKTKDLQEILDQ